MIALKPTSTQFATSGGDGGGGSGSDDRTAESVNEALSWLRFLFLLLRLPLDGMP